MKKVSAKTYICLRLFWFAGYPQYLLSEATNVWLSLLNLVAPYWCIQSETRIALFFVCEMNSFLFLFDILTLTFLELFVFSKEILLIFCFHIKLIWDKLGFCISAVLAICFICTTRTTYFCASYENNL